MRDRIIEGGKKKDKRKHGNDLKKNGQNKVQKESRLLKEYRIKRKI